MIQYHEGVPFCKMQKEEAGLSIYFDGVVTLLHDVEKDIMKMEVPDGTAYTSNDISSRFNQWNIFYIPSPILMPIFKLFKAGWEQYKEEIHFGKDPLWIHAHGNLHRKDQQLKYHAHRYPILGYVGISSEGSNTTFYTGENEDIPIPIPNKNGQLVMTMGPIPHQTDVWDKDYPRCSVAFNLMTHQDIQNEGHGPLFPFDL